MATKNHCLSISNKEESFGIIASNGQYNNLNLNQNKQYSSKNKLRSSKCLATNENRNSERTAALTKLLDTDNSQKTREGCFRDKLIKDLPSDFWDQAHEKRKENRRKEFGYREKGQNNSTLSLHITAYENSIENISGNSINGNENALIKKNKEEKGLIKKCKNATGFFSDSVVESIFELPRQQERDKLNNPEVMQFKTSQRLFNPNQVSLSAYMHDPATMTNDLNELKIEKSNREIKKKTNDSPSRSPSAEIETHRSKDEQSASQRMEKDRNKEVQKSSNSHSKEKDSDRHRSKDKERNERRRSRSRDNDRRKYQSRSVERGKRDDRHRDSRDRDRRIRKRSTSRDRSRHSSRDRDYRRRRSPSPYKSRRRSPSPRRRRRSPPWRRTTRLPGPERRDVMYFQPSKSMPEGSNPNMTPEERDERTIFILQLARDTKPTDLETFFESIGNVRDVRIITDSRTGRSKGIAYVEFWERESVALALGLNKQRLLGAPLIIQQSCAERNRQAAQTLGGALGFTTSFNATGPMKLIVENLHPDINDKMLLDIFEPFGKVTVCKVVRGADRSSLGYANLGFKNADDAKKVLEQMNGYEIAGRALRIKIEEQEESQPSPPYEPVRERLQKDEKMELGHTGRLHVMAKLAEGSGMNVPQATRDTADQFLAAQQTSVPPYATTTFFLSGLFDPATETGENWADEIADDVLTECNQYGGVWHIYVDKNASEGNVYIKCPTVLVASNCVAALHGRFFAGRMVTANYLPASSYHEMFPESRFASTLLQPRR